MVYLIINYILIKFTKIYNAKHIQFVNYEEIYQVVGFSLDDRASLLIIVYGLIMSTSILLLKSMLKELWKFYFFTNNLLMQPTQVLATLILGYNTIFG